MASLGLKWDFILGFATTLSSAANLYIYRIVFVFDSDKRWFTAIEIIKTIEYITYLTFRTSNSIYCGYISSILKSEVLYFLERGHHSEQINKLC